jgi:hypothetical protein
MPRTTGSATPTTPAPGAMTPHGSASSCLPTTKQTPQTRQKPATERFPPTQELDHTKVRGQARLPLAAEGGRHQRVTSLGARARSEACRGVPRGAAASSFHRRESLRARELGKQARERINVDFDVDNPNTLPRASQKLVAAATLLRAMPAPSMPEARNLHREARCHTWI